MTVTVTRDTLQRVATAPTSLRERKKERTRLAIQQVALDLFERNGYERTTIEQIAADAEVSPSTVYRYFETKEAIVFWDRWDPRVLDLIAARPVGEQPIASLLAAVQELLPLAMAEEQRLIRRRVELALQVPELQSHVNDQSIEVTELVVRTLAARDGRSPDSFELRVVVHAATTAMILAMQAWARDEGDLKTLVERALAVLVAGAKVPDDAGQSDTPSPRARPRARARGPVDGASGAGRRRA